LPLASLTEIQDSVGRAFRLTYTNGYVSSLVDPLNRTWRYTQNAAGDLVSFSDPTGATIVYEYDTAHRMVRALTARGTQLLRNTYDSAGRVATQTNGRGHTWTFAYDTSSGVTTVTDPNGARQAHQHDQSFRLQRSVDRLEHTSQILYDERSNPAQMSDQKGNYYQFEYDLNGNVLGRRDPLQRTRKFDYDSSNRPTRVENELGHASTIAWDERGNMTGMTDALSSATAITYNEFGQPLTFRDPRGNTTTLTYDSRGNLVAIDAPLSRRTTFTYDIVGRRLTATDPLGRTTTFTYDAGDRVTRVTDAMGHTVQFGYDANGNLISRTDERGNTVRQTYDENDLVSSVTDPLGATTHYGYDKLDQLIGVRNARQAITLLENDPAGRVVGQVDALGQTTRFTYDANGNRTAVTDAMGETRVFQYDALNRLVGTSDPLRNRTTRAYDAAGRLLSIDDERGNRTTFAYDAANRLTRVTDASGGAVSYAYDASGNRTSQTDANGHVTTYEYDGADRLTAIRDPNGRTQRFTYDAADRRITSVDAAGRTTRFTYDDDDRLVQTTYPDGSIVRRAYDAAGNLTQMTDRLGTSFYAYDANNRLTSHTDAFGQTIRYTYDAVGNLATLVYPGNLAVRYAYDAANRLVSVTDWGDRVTRYEYDRADRVTRVTLPNGLSTTYAYDSAGRLVRQINGPGVASYVFNLDAAGNRLSATITEPLDGPTPGANESYAYDAADQVQSAGSASFAFDSAGNMTRWTKGGATTNYTYDFDNQLTWINSSVQFGYDGLGVRRARAVNGVTSYYVVDANAPLSQVLTQRVGQQGPVSAYYIYGLGLLYRIAPDGQRLYYQFNPTGSTVAMVNEGGEMVNRYAYDAWGNTSAVVEDVPNPFRFMGSFGVMQEGQDLLFVRARYYAPMLGRFVSRDPVRGSLADTQRPNPYSYANGNPAGNIDPSGESWAKISAWGKKTFDTITDKTSTALVKSGLFDYGSPLYRATAFADHPTVQRVAREVPGTIMNSAILGGATIAAGFADAANFVTRGALGLGTVADIMRTTQCEAATQLTMNVARAMDLPISQTDANGIGAQVTFISDVTNFVGSLGSVREIGKLQNTINVNHMIGRSMAVPATLQAAKGTELLRGTYTFGHDAMDAYARGSTKSASCK
jgi:RHS repeat-associated protein